MCGGSGGGYRWVMVENFVSICLSIRDPNSEVFFHFLYGQKHAREM